MDDGSKLEAMAYIMNPRLDFGIPTQRYYNTVCEGYEDCGLDVEILNRAVDDSIALYREREQKQSHINQDDSLEADESEEEFECEDPDYGDEPNEDNPFPIRF